MKDGISKGRIENFSNMTHAICEAVIKPEIHPWDSIGAMMQSIVVVSAASGIPLEEILKRINEILSNSEATEERHRLETEYKKEVAKTKNHLSVAPK